MASLSRCVVCDVVSALPEDRSMSSERDQPGDRESELYTHSHTHWSPSSKKIRDVSQGVVASLSLCVVCDLV